MTAFTDAMTQLPFNARQAHATGFLPPIIRTVGHLSLLLAVVADEDDTSLTDDQLADELEHTTLHWGAIDRTENVSATARQAISNIGDALVAARDEWPEWDRKTRVRNVRDLANRIVAFSADLDRELVGIRNADAGTTL